MNIERIPSANSGQNDHNAHYEDALLLSDSLQRLVNNREMADVSFLLGPEQDIVYGHRCILGARSPVFKAMLFGPLKETHSQIVIPNIHRDDFIVMLEYLYGGTTRNLTAENAMNVLAAANQYEILTLMSICIQFIQDALTVDNVCSILVQTMGNYIDIYEMCIEFIEANAEMVLETESFLELPESMLIDLIKRDYLFVNEFSIFNAVLKWGRHQLQKIQYVAAGSGDESTEVVSRNDTHTFLQSDDNLNGLRKVLENVVLYIRLPLLRFTDLYGYVRTSGVIPHHVYRQAMEYLAAPAELKGQLQEHHEQSTETSEAVVAFYKPRTEAGAIGTLFEFQWEPHEDFYLSTRNLLASKRGDHEWRGIYGNKSIFVPAHTSNSKVYKFKYVIRFEVEVRGINIDKSGMIIGMGRKPERDDYTHCFGFGGSGQSYPSQARIPLRNGSTKDDIVFNNGDIIGVKFDTLKRQISYYKNGKLVFVNPRQPPLGVELFPVVFMHYNNDQVAIREKDCRR